MLDGGDDREDYDNNDYGGGDDDDGGGDSSDVGIARAVAAYACNPRLGSGSSPSAL